MASNSFKLIVLIFFSAYLLLNFGCSQVRPFNLYVQLKNDPSLVAEFKIKDKENAQWESTGVTLPIRAMPAPYCITEQAYLDLVKAYRNNKECKK